MDVIEAKVLRTSDESGGKLYRFLSTYLALERAVVRRRVFVHLSALLAVPVWLAAMLSRLHSLRPIVFGLFAGAAFGSLVSLALEMRSLKSFRAAEQEMRVSAAPND